MTLMTIGLPGLEVLSRPLDIRRADGVYLGPDGLEGWDDGPDMRRETAARVAAAGDFDATGYAEARVVSFSGVIVSPSEERTRYWMRRLTGVLAGGGLGTISVRRPDGAQFGRAGLVKAKAQARAGARHYADWQLQLWMPDPRKYGSIRTFGPGTTVVANHYGNAAAAPRLIVSGSDPSGYWLAGPGGRAWQVTLPLVTQFPHTIDMATGLLTANGTVRANATPRADIWRIPPGAVVSQSVAGTSGGAVSLQAVVADTYL